jgi:hypothetical protein
MILWSSLLWGLITLGNHQSAQAQVLACPDLQADRPGFNSVWRSLSEGQVQRVGRQHDQHYGVIVPSDAEQNLPRVQVCVPDAFLVESRWGPYVQSGFFYRRVEAEILSKALRSRRIDSRVVYYP